jgi:hypothetical protein
LTGITDICGHKQVLAEISEPGKPVLRPVLAEGEALGAVEILRIDVPQARVKIRINGEGSVLSLPAVPPGKPPLERLPAAGRS